jgi:hypothetical protein
MMAASWEAAAGAQPLPVSRDVPRKPVNLVLIVLVLAVAALVIASKVLARRRVARLKLSGGRKALALNLIDGR